MAAWKASRIDFGSDAGIKLSLSELYTHGNERHVANALRNRSTRLFPCHIDVDEIKRIGNFAFVGYVALALGVLTKGPVALALVAMPIVLEVMISRKRTELKQLKIVSGLLLFLLITAPYFLLVYARFGAEPLRFFFFGENLQRFTGQVYGTSGRPFWYELAAFFSDFAPWSFLIFVAAWFDWRTPGHDETRRRAVRILYFWLACAVVLFSISSFKLDYYLLPAMPAAALIIGNVIANSEKLTLIARTIVELFLVLCSFVILVVALLSLRAADVLSVQTSLRFLPAAVAVAGLAAICAYVFRRKTWQASIVLAATLWATILSMECAFLPAFARYFPSTQLTASVPADRVWYTSWAASEWANSLAFNLAPTQRVERLIGDLSNQRLQDVLKNDPVAVAVIWEREYAGLAENDPGLSIIAQAETFGHGGLSLNMIRHPKRERLLVVGHDR